MVVTQGLQVWARQWHVQLLGSSGACNGVFVKEFVVAGRGRVFRGLGAGAGGSWVGRAILPGFPRHRVLSNAARSGVHALT